MPLQEQVVPVQLAVGLDAGTEPKLTQKLHRCENAVFKRRGAISKRYGLTELTGTHTEQAMAAYKDRPMLLGYEDLKAYDGTTPTDGTFGTVANMRAWNVRRVTCSSRGNYAVNPGIGALSNIAAIGWRNYEFGSANLPSRLMTKNLYTGTLIDEVQLDPGAPVKVEAPVRIVAGENVGYLWAIYYKAATGQLAYRAIAGSGSIGAENIMFAVAAGGSVAFDVAVFTNTDLIGIGYKAPSGLAEVAVWNMATGAAVGTYTVAGSAPTGSVFGCYALSATIVCMLWYESLAGPNYNVEAIGVSSAAALAVSQAQVYTSPTDIPTSASGVATTTTTSLTYINSDTVGNGAPTPSAVLTHIHRNSFDNVAGVGTPGVSAIWLRDAWVIARPFLYSTDVVVPVYYHGRYDFNTGAVSSSQRCMVLVWDNAAVSVPVARALVGVAEWPVVFSPGPIALDAVNSQWLIAGAEQVAVDGRPALTYVSAEPAVLPRSVETVDTLWIPAGLALEWDGRSLVESGFIHGPENISGVGAIVGGGPLTAAGTYSYVATYEWHDDKGRLHRSAPSPAVSVTLGGADNAANVTVNNLQLSRKSGVTIVLWRTTIGPGSIWYRVKEVANAMTADNTVIADSAAGDTDANISTRERLYTTGGVLANVAPLPCRTACAWQGRICYVDDEADSYRVRYSHALADGVATSFSDLLEVDAGTDGGRINALIPLDDKLIAGKQTRLHALYGQPLSATGLGVGFREPFIVSESVGCISARSVVRIPGGSMFQAQSGLYIIAPNLEVSFIGEPVRYYTQDSALAVVSAVLVPDIDSVVFFTSSTALVYNYHLGLWATWTNHAASSAVIAANRVYHRRPGTTAQNVRVENRAIFTDPGPVGVFMAVETGWIALAGVGGFQRIRRALFQMHNIAAHNLKVQAAYDGEPYWQDARTFSAVAGDVFAYGADYGAGLGVGIDGKAHTVEFAPSRQKCSSIRFRIEDTLSGVEGWDIYAMALRVAVKTKTKRTGSERRF